MNERNLKDYDDDDEIDLIEYLLHLKKHLWKILIFSFFITLLSVFYALSLDNIYRADVLLMPVGGESGNASRIPGNLIGVAQLSGIQLNVPTSADAKLEILKTRVFLRKVIGENNLMPLLFPGAWDSENKKWKEKNKGKRPEIESGIGALKNAIGINRSAKSGLVTIINDNKDPKLAAEWLMLLVNTLNRHLKKEVISESKANISFLEKELRKTPLTEMRRTLFTIIEEQTRQMMLAGTREDFAFKIIDPAVTPQSKYKPNRKNIVIITAFASFMLAAFISLLFEAYKKMKRRREEEVSHV